MRVRIISLFFKKGPCFHCRMLHICTFMRLSQNALQADNRAVCQSGRSQNPRASAARNPNPRSVLPASTPAAFPVESGSWVWHQRVTKPGLAPSEKQAFQGLFWLFSELSTYRFPESPPRRCSHQATAPLSQQSSHGQGLRGSFPDARPMPATPLSLKGRVSWLGRELGPQEH